MKTRVLLTAIVLGAVCATQLAAVPVSDIPTYCVPKGTDFGSVVFTVSSVTPTGAYVFSGDPLLVAHGPAVCTVAGETVTVTFPIVTGATGTAPLHITLLNSFFPIEFHDILFTVAPPLMVQCSAPAPVIADLHTCGAIVNFTPPVATGGCGVPSITCVPSSGSFFAVGTTPVECTVVSGSETQTCGFDVIVTTPASSTVVCPDDITVTLPASQDRVAVTYSAVVANNCGLSIQQFVPPSGSGFGPGTTEVQCFALNSDNQEVTCTFTVTVVPSNPDLVCPLGKGHWKHVEAWPIVTELELGAEIYTKEQLQTLLQLSTKGDASVILASQLIPALLNVANGSDPEPIEQALTDAFDSLDTLDAQLPCEISPNSALGQRMIHTAAALELYNEGWLTADCNPF